MESKFKKNWASSYTQCCNKCLGSAILEIDSIQVGQQKKLPICK